MNPTTGDPGTETPADTRTRPAETDRRSGIAERQRRDRNGVIAFVAAIVLTAVVSFVYAAFWGDDEPLTPNAEELAGVSAFSYQGGMHTNDDVTYTENPPLGGAHAAVWQNCGTYDQPVLDERAVHSLEHGAVWITYRPDLDPAQVAELAAFASTLDFILLSPRDDLPSPIVVSAWNHQLQMESTNTPGLAPFVEEFRKSMTSPEPGAPCTGGTSEPA